MDDPIVCYCFSVTQQEVIAAIQRDDVETLFDLMGVCKAGNGCNSCWGDLQRLLNLKPPKQP